MVKNFLKHNWNLLLMGSAFFLIMGAGMTLVWMAQIKYPAW